MKTLKLLLMIIGILTVVFFCAVILFVKTFDISKYETLIVDEMSSAMGRKVEIGSMNLTFTLREGIVFVVHDLKIADDPIFSPDSFLEVQKITLDVDLFALLGYQKLLNCRFHVYSPSITIIRDEDGLLNVQTLGSNLASLAQMEEKGKKGQQISGKTVQLGGALTILLIKKATLQNGNILYIDKQSYPETSLRLSKIDFNINNFSLLDQFDFELKASLANDQQNVSLSGLAQIYPHPLEIRLENVQLLLEISESLFVPFKKAISDIGKITSAEGHVRANINQAAFTPSGAREISLAGNLTNGRLKIDRLASPMSQIKVDFGTIGQDLNVSQYAFNFANGKMQGQGRITNYLTNPSFSFDGMITDVQLDQAVDQRDFSAKVLGKVFSEARLSGKVLKDEDLLYSLAGNGKVQVKEGKIVDINVLRFVLGKISMIPNLYEKIEANLSEKYKKSLKEKDTKLNKVELTSEISKGEILLRKLTVEADTFGLSGNGVLNFNRDITLNMAIFIPSDLSQNIIASVPEIEGLLDEQGQIYIPLTPYKGNVRHIKMFPDMSYLGTKLIINRGRQELKKIINKALDIEEEPPVEGQPSSGATTESGQTAPQKQQKKRPEQILIDNVLDKIFK